MYFQIKKEIWEKIQYSKIQCFLKHFPKKRYLADPVDRSVHRRTLMVYVFLCKKYSEGVVQRLFLNSSVCGLDLETACFYHRQLYTTCSLVGTIVVLSKDGRTKNIVGRLQFIFFSTCIINRKSMNNYFWCLVSYQELVVKTYSLL